MENKYTEKATLAINEAANFANNYNNSEVKVEHLLLALIGQTNGLIPNILQKMGVNISSKINELRNKIDKFPKISGDINLSFSRELSTVIMNSRKEMENFSDEYISTEHLFLASINYTDINKKVFMEELKKVRGNSKVNTQNPEGIYDVLNKYGKN
ncbi:Clp protease N-terminal domain-containing protein, partial [Oceanivirga salmonicida]